jgi:hypothetical protein
MNTALFLGLLACGSSEKETDTAMETDTAETTDDSFFDTIIYVENPPIGEMSCFSEGYSDAWAEQIVSEDVITEISVSGAVIDFETDDPVPDASIEIYYSNTVYGAPDQSYTSDGAGNFTGTVPTCTPYAYRVSTDPDLGATKVTIKVSQVDGAAATGSEYNSVSIDTYNVIPALLGISPDVDKGIVAGTAYDCAGEPLEFAQIIVTDADGNIPESEVVRYFVDSFPSRLQEWTSEDGLFVVVNIPEGEWIVNMYVSDGAGGHLLMGQSPVKVFPDSINISSTYTSFGDGVRYPANCLTAE